MMLVIPRDGRSMDLASILGGALTAPPVSPDEEFARAKQAFDEMKARIDGFVHGANARKMEQLAMDYETAFHERSAAFGIDHDLVVQRYLESAIAFAQHVYTLASINESVFQPGLWQETMQLLTPWQIAEENYAGLGFRTVPFADWFRSCRSPFVMKTVPQPVWHLLLVNREPGEPRTLHAGHKQIGEALQTIGKQLIAE